MEEFLTLHGFDKEWTAPKSLRLKVFPKFLSRIGSHVYRLHDTVPGSGMLLRNGQWVEPDTAIRP